MEKFVIENEDAFQRLHALLKDIAALEADGAEHMGRRRYPMKVYMGDTRTSVFLYGNKELYRRDAHITSRGVAATNATLGTEMQAQMSRAEQGCLRLTDKEAP